MIATRDSTGHPISPIELRKGCWLCIERKDDAIGYIYGMGGIGWVGLDLHHLHETKEAMRSEATRL